MLWTFLSLVGVFSLLGVFPLVFLASSSSVKGSEKAIIQSSKSTPILKLLAVPLQNLCSNPIMEQDIIEGLKYDEDKISKIRVTGKFDKADERELYRQHVFKTDGGVKEEHTCSRAS